jgi:hypothetical protein
MSWQAVTWVLELSESESYSRLVMLSIASHANREGKNAFPSLDTIAREALICRREVIYCVQALEEKGELKVVRGVGRGNPNHYDLPYVAIWLEKMHQSKELKGAQKTVKGAQKRIKGANKPPETDLNSVESASSSSERLKVKSNKGKEGTSFRNLIPEPPKTASQAELLAERDRQLAAMREKGYIQ